MSRLDDFVPQRGVIADFNLNPTLGSETGKIRPCVIVSNDIYNQKLSVIQVVPITVWSAKKAKIITNVLLNPSSQNGLSKKSLADCLQTRPIDYVQRYISMRGRLDKELMNEINEALKIIFDLEN